MAPASDKLKSAAVLGKTRSILAGMSAWLCGIVMFLGSFWGALAVIGLLLPGREIRGTAGLATFGSILMCSLAASLWIARRYWFVARKSTGVSIVMILVCVGLAWMLRPVLMGVLLSDG